MKSRAALVASLALILVAGCKPKPESSPAPAPNTNPASGNHDATGPITEAALGLKIYPGARIVTSGETDEVVSANLETADAPELVVKFYRQELGLPADGAATMDLSEKKNGRLYAISMVRSDGVTAVSIMGKK